jgi:hypothetical protein
MRLIVRRSLLTALCVGAPIAWQPLHAQVIPIGPGEPPELADPVAISLYRRPLLGPYLLSEASAVHRTRMPDPESGCSITRTGWTWPLCRPVTGNAGDRAASMTGAEVRASVGFPESPYRGARICGPTTVNGIFSGCGTMAGAIASSAYTGIRAHAEARGGESFTLTIPDLDTPEPTDDIEVDYGFFSAATATGEWTNELTSDFSDWVELNMGVEMHARWDDPLSALFDPLSLGSGLLEFGLFRKPPGLVPPPLCPGGPGVDGCGEGWSFYGRNWEEEYANPNFYGWDFVGGDNVGISSIGLTPITFGFMAEAGATYSLVMRFAARARDNEYADFWGTAKLNYFEVPEGGSLSFAEGDFEVRTRGAGGPPSVPEPASVWLLLGGAVGLLSATRRRLR